MGHVRPGIKAGQNYIRPKDNLNQDSENQNSSICSDPSHTRVEKQRCRNGKNHRSRNEPCKQSIDLLNRRVPRRDINKLGFVAIGPIRAAEAGARQPHQRACDDDGVKGAKGDPHDLSEPQSRYLRTTHRRDATPFYAEAGFTYRICLGKHVLWLIDHEYPN